MSDVAIAVEGLGKRYRIGSRQRYKSLRESLMSPFGRMGRSSSERAAAETLWALKDVSFEVKRGEVVGVIGRNGAGKSTLLRVMSRITEPSEGLVDVYGRVGSLLEVGTGFHPELTGRENVFLNGAILGMRRTEIERRFDEIVAFAEVERFIDTPVKHYSSGMYMRLAFAVAAHLETEILVVDEVLAVGDAAFQRKCLAKMGDVARHGRTVLFVSHNLGAVSNLCDRGIVLEGGRVQFAASSQAAIDYYNRRVLASAQQFPDREPHILFEEEPGPSGLRSDFRITRIEQLDSAGAPKPALATWDDVVIRIWYRAERRLERGSVVVELRTLEGTRLLLLSTQPDSILDVTLEPGEHAVDCAIKKLPIASGDYVLGAGLAVPNAEWLWLNSDLARLTVLPRDVFGSGLAPVAARALIAPDHYWRVASS
jgi:lipopolysaccharide transport system ATP-binding protein